MDQKVTLNRGHHRSQGHGGVDEKKKKETKSDIRREPIVNQTSVKSGVDICSTSADNEVSHVSLQLFNTSTDARLVHHLSEQTPSCSEGGPGV